MSSKASKAESMSGLPASVNRADASLVQVCSLMND